jgi:hypothetical protein
MRFTVLSIYRGHVIVVLLDEDLTAEITERASGAPLPTEVSATRDEGMNALINRAKHLSIDIREHVMGWPHLAAL